MRALSFGAPPSPPTRTSNGGKTTATMTKSAGAVPPVTSPPRRQLSSIDANRLQNSGGSSSSATARKQQGNGIHAGNEKENDEPARRMLQKDTSVPMDLVASTSTGSLVASQTLERAMQEHSISNDDTTTTIRTKRSKKTKKRRQCTLHIEVALLPNVNARQPRPDTLRKAVHDFITKNFDSLLPESLIVDWEDYGILAQHVDQIRVAECSAPGDIIKLEDVTLSIHVYTPARAFIVDSFSASPTEDGDAEDGGTKAGEDSDVMAATVAQLPAMALEGIWDNLVYEDNVKLRLLNYIYSTQLFGDRQVDFNVITWNRVVLLHGPPGTGKTSLCRALAQKLAIRLSDRYTHGKLVEINSHSIMSKWFSESGKLVQRLFSNVLELVEDESCFVVVLIDEVESLTSARAGAMSGKEPSDAVRVVNALLTQLDKLKNKKNVLVMTTSNLSTAIDSAFIDRADIKQYIGLPPVQAVYWILIGCLRELMRSGIIRESELLDWKRLKLHQDGYTDDKLSKRTVRNSVKLLKVSELCHGMSGRTLRRLPLLAHTRYIANGSADYSSSSVEDDIESDEDEDDLDDDEDEESESLEVWLEAMLETVKAEKEQMQMVEEGCV